MRVGCIGVLTGCMLGCGAVGAAESSEGFIEEVPELLRARLLSTNAFSGTFVQTKTNPDGRAFVSRGTYRVRPGVDFEWRTTDPFDTLFFADQKNYVYSNEDECVTKPLKDLKGFSHFSDVGEGDFSKFLKTFDSRYKEEADGVFHVLSRPTERHLVKFLSRVEADGTVSNWVLKATFPDKTVFEVKFHDN